SCFVFCNVLLQFFGHSLDVNFVPSHASGFPYNYVVFLRPCGIDAWMIDAAMRPAAFCTGQGTIRDGFGDSEHGLQVKGKMPTRIEKARAFDTSLCRTGF